MKYSSIIVAVCTAVALAFAGCSSSTVIRSNVPGAKVYLDGAYVGNTPYTMTDTKIVGSSTSVRIEADGYAPTHATITRSEELSVIACIGGVLILIPFLWIMGYKADHVYQLAPGGGQPGPSPYPAPQPGYEKPGPLTSPSS